jgi:excinuclease ABC subunit A
MKFIKVKGAKMHNLKNIDVEIPRDKLVVITGVSGSGKSSLAFDTIYAEGQRRYVESLSTYARQFLQLMEKPEVEAIEGLSPAISIDQKTASRNPRSTVGTVTEIYDYLRLLFAKIGHPHCPQCGKKVTRQSASQIIEEISKMPEEKKIILLAPIIKDKKGEHSKVIEKIKKGGFVRMRIDGTVMTVVEELDLDPNKKHDVEIVIDRLVVKNFKRKIITLPSGKIIEDLNPDRTRLADSVELALKHGHGIMKVLDVENDQEIIFSENFACIDCGVSLPDIEPRSFSFNSPHGACPMCHGLGTKLKINPKLVIPNDKLTIAEGAIMPWATSSTRLNWYIQILKTVAKKYNFSLNTPWKNLKDDQKKIVLNGTGKDSYNIKFSGEKFDGDYHTTYEGVIPNLERRYAETDSDYSRKQIERFMEILSCEQCQGKRLKPEALSITVANKNIIEITESSVLELVQFFKKLVPQEGKHHLLSENEYIIAKMIFKEIGERLHFLENVGLSYLTLDRSANTLSGGEAQRIRLATQIGSSLLGVLYVLDEPSIGLHQKDNSKLIKTLMNLRDLGNTVLVVEHDEETMLAADYIIEIGPQAGKHGGEVVAVGTPAEIMSNKKSITGQYLSHQKTIDIPDKRRKGTGKFLEVHGAKEHNLKNVSVKFPLGSFVGITGVSGSGKSSLINYILVPTLTNKLNRAKLKEGNFKEMKGIEHLDKVISIDQSPIGRTPRSNPATYTGVFTDIRELFATTTEAKLRGYKAGRFSFNVKGGRCEACRGDGIVKIEMHFLPDVYVSCEVCKGKRYNNECLEISYRGKNIADVLDMTVSEALDFFSAIPQITQKLQTLEAVGLGYIHLGQPATTLSGGEAQRIKLATELSRKSTGKTIYILDEPTTGLHFDDVKKLLSVLQQLVDKGNTVITIEHNLDVIKSVDYIIDLGPDGGINGGEIIAQGKPEEVAKIKQSYTGEYLKKILKKG